MSDEFYQERARRRTRLLLVAGGLAAVVICAVAGVVSLLYDACTKSFDRSPRAVVFAYLDAVTRGDLPVAQECWEHHTYYDLEAGCSEICLSRVLGTRFEVLDLELGDPHGSADGRANLLATVSIVCAEGGESHDAEIRLDSVGSNLPWKHWSIVHSTFGGTLADPWCR
jgi:hypothetical protein